MTATRRAGDPAVTPPAARRWWVLVVLGTAQLMVVLDATIVNIALPAAQADLGFPDSSRQWVVTAYSLAFGSLLLLGGRLADLLGRRQMFLIGLVGFAVASALGGAAPDFEVLIAARVAQGVFGALLAPAALSLLSTTFTDPAERGKAFGIFGALAGAGAAVGLLLGGVLTELLSWRWCLYVNLAFAAFAVVGALVLLRNVPADGSRQRLDLPGTAAITAGVFSIVFGFARAESDGWTDPLTLAFILGGVALVAAFVVIESKVAQPLLPLRVTLDRNRGGAYLAVLLIATGVFAVFLFLTFFLQGTLGFSPIKTGLAFMPMAIAISISATAISPQALPRVGPRPLMTVGFVLAALGMYLLSRLEVDSSYLADVVPGTLLVGFGFGAVIAPGIQVSISGVEPRDAGVASALSNVGQQVGGSIGTALLSTLAVRAAEGYVAERGPSSQVFAEAAVESYTRAFSVASVLLAISAVVIGALLRSGPAEHAPEGVAAVG